MNRITILLVFTLLSKVYLVQEYIELWDSNAQHTSSFMEDKDLTDSLPPIKSRDDWVTVNQAQLASFHACCTDLFFSEYVEGTGNNQALGIYNPGGNIVDLTQYVIFRFDNGAMMATDTFLPTRND